MVEARGDDDDLSVALSHGFDQQQPDLVNREVSTVDPEFIRSDPSTTANPMKQKLDSSTSPSSLPAAQPPAATTNADGAAAAVEAVAVAPAAPALPVLTSPTVLDASVKSASATMDFVTKLYSDNGIATPVVGGATSTASVLPGISVAVLQALLDQIQEAGFDLATMTSREVCGDDDM